MVFAHSPTNRSIRAVILDWSGTAIDFGCVAPAQVMVDIFASVNIAVPLKLARKPMGLPKWFHIEALLAEPDISEKWIARFGRPPDDGAVDDLYQLFLDQQTDVVTDFATPVPGLLGALESLRREGIRIGSTTGYPRAVMEKLAPAAAAQGFSPESMVCPDDVPSGRPSPLMALKSMIDLGVWPARACIKVDDTAPGIAEGLNAGMWTVGVVMTGNSVGLDEETLFALSAEDRDHRIAEGRDSLYAAGAHYVVDSAADLPAVVEAIQLRMGAMEVP